MSSWRSLLRNTARPVIDPVWHRVWARIEARLAPIEARLSGPNGGGGSAPGGADHDARSWHQLAPAFLNAVSTVEAFGHALSTTRSEVSELRKRVDQARDAQDLLRTMRIELSELRKRVDQAQDAQDLLRTMRIELSELRERVDRTQDAQDLTAVWDRIEFVRRELMFEQRYGRAGATSPHAARSNAVVARVVDTAKLETMRGSQAGLRLNLGCGHIPLEGYINVDRRDLPGVDVVAAVDDLPFEPNSISEISSAHLLEHFPEEMLRRNLLPYWHSLLRPGGCFRAVVPDGQAMLSKVASGEMPFADFREVLFGAQDYEGDFHYDMFTPASLTALLEEAGFHDVAVPVAGRRNGKCYEFEIVGQRP